MTSLDTKLLPNFRWMQERPWRICAFGFGAGLSKIAPGTVGTLWAWAATLIYHMFYPSFEVHESLILLISGLIMGVWACGLCCEELGQSDYSGIVWDEILAFWLILFFIVPCSWQIQCTAFILFRFFDIAKPGPIHMVDHYFKNWQPTLETSLETSLGTSKIIRWIRGFGVMVDDLLAALATLMVLSLLIRIGVLTI